MEVLKIKECTRIVAGCFYNLLAFVANFELKDITVVE